MSTMELCRAVAQQTKFFLQSVYESEPRKYMNLLQKSELHDASSENKEIAANVDRPYQTKVIVQKGDTIDVAKMYIQDRPCVLNMASDKQAGGGWLNGAMAQEEALCRRSELWVALADPFYCGGKWRRYPLMPLQCIYTPDVTVLRDSNHEWLKVRDQFKLDFLSMPAVRNPVVLNNDYANPGQKELMKNKIRTILRVAHKRGHHTLVLGAFGCGAFGNPPRVVAKMFKEIFSEPEFDGLFKTVVFAIIDSQYTDNYGVFADEFGQNDAART